MPKGIQTGSYSAPEQAKGASYAHVPDVSLSARGDMPAMPVASSPQGYRGPDEAGFENKSTANISKLGPSA